MLLTITVCLISVLALAAITIALEVSQVSDSEPLPEVQ